MKKIFSTSFVATIIVILMFAMPQFFKQDTKSKGVRISGSNSMYSLMKKIVDSVVGDNLIEAEIIGSKGSTTGIKDIIDGNAEIAMSSRAIKSSEIKVFEQLKIKEKTIALDPIAVIVNKDNPVTNISKEQLKNIYLGKITNWNQLGGKDQKIIPVARPATSGTREAFDELIDIQKGTLLAKNTIEKGETGECKTMVTENPGVIAYVALHAADQVVNTVSIDNIKQTKETVKSKNYKLSRPFVLAYRQEGEQFVNLIDNPKVQQLIEGNNYVLPDKKEETKWKKSYMIIH